MKNVRKIIAAGLVLALAAGLAACGGGGDDTADVLKTAQEKIAAVKSLSCNMTMNTDMSSNGQTMQTVSSMDIDMVKEPLALAMNLSMDYGTQKMEMPMYAEQIADGYAVYASADGGATWTKQIVADAAVMEQYDAAAAMDTYLKSLGTLKEKGAETIEGQEAVRYDGAITEEAMNEIMAFSGVEQQLTMLGVSQEQAADMYKDIGEMKASVWIAKDSSLPVKFEMDMTTIMQTLMDNAVKSIGEGAEGLEFQVDKMSVSIVLSNFDAVEVTIPEAAKNV